MADLESPADMKWVSEGKDSSHGVNNAIIEALRQLIKDKDKKAVRKIVEGWCRVSKRSLRIYCDKKR